MLEALKKQRLITRLRKTRWYFRLRQNFPELRQPVADDSEQSENADVVTIDWPRDVRKPVFGLLQDSERCPRWTKYRRFLRNNGFRYSLYNLHAHNWLQMARNFDVVVGICSCEPWHLQELRQKYYFLEHHLGIKTYPSTDEVLLYENKKLEAYLAKALGIPFARTFISHDREDALAIIEKAKYPLVSKVVPASGSVGVQLVRNRAQAARIIQAAFSANGRKTHFHYFRQKNCVYFQEFIPNDGFDIRVIVVGNMLFGYYRKVPAGDFRASGMGLVEKRALPEEAMQITLELNGLLKSPMLVVDFVHALTGEYYVIEYSPVCQMDTPEQLHVDGVPGAYIWTHEGGFRFQPCRYWVMELALKQYLLQNLRGAENSALAALVSLREP